MGKTDDLSILNSTLFFIYSDTISVIAGASDSDLYFVKHFTKNIVSLH